MSAGPNEKGDLSGTEGVTPDCREPMCLTPKTEVAGNEEEVELVEAKGQDKEQKENSLEVPTMQTTMQSPQSSISWEEDPLNANIGSSMECCDSSGDVVWDLDSSIDGDGRANKSSKMCFDTTMTSTPKH